jgi:hypothetical protein
VTELDRPIKQLLREREIPVDVLWACIEAKRSRPLSSLATRATSATSAAPAASWTRAAGFAGALSAVFVLAALAVVLVVPRAQLGWFVSKPVDGPLTRSNGDMLSVLDTSGSDAALDVLLSDGSQLHLDPGAKLVTERSDAHQFRVAVSSGRVVFDVKPKGQRRWIIDAGDTRVEVIGTRFSVENATGRVTVAVVRGRVEVRGARVPHGSVAMGQGEKLVLEPPPSAAVVPPQSSPHADADANGHALPSETAAEPASNALSADQLLRVADAARARGDYRHAARSLSRFLTDHPVDSRAAIVALTLGRIQLDQLASPKAAAASFARADRLGLPEADAEEGAARLVEAYAKSGEKKLARAAATRYVRRFPDGPRSANVAAWLDLD